MKGLLQKIGLPMMHRLDPETAHGLALKALQMGLAPSAHVTSARLATSVAGLSLPNPVGLAAGFDKNAVAVGPLLNSGFGFIEVGATTPYPQPGNPKPRLFRLSEDQAAINRFGFNNDGMEVIADRLKQPRDGILGINLGANKDSKDRADDFAKVLTTCGPYVDFATVNVSSPNTESLRDLQGKAALAGLLKGVMEAQNSLEKSVAIFLKIAPDLERQELEDIVEVAENSGISGIIATNTTITRDNLLSRHADQKGGLSGQPLFDKSTRILAQLSILTDLPLIGVGGIATAEQAYAKICAGASIVQLYTALVYKGINLGAEIAEGLDRLLERDGHLNITAAVGTKKKEYL